MSEKRDLSLLPAHFSAWFQSRGWAAHDHQLAVLAAVQAAIFAFPYDFGAVTKIATLREQELDPDRIVNHIRQVEADFADAIAEHLARRGGPDDLLRIAVTSRTIAAAVFAAMEVWSGWRCRAPGMAG